MDEVKYYAIVDTGIPLGSNILWNTISTDLNLLQSIVCDNFMEEAYSRFYCQNLRLPNSAMKYNESYEDYLHRIAKNNWNFVKDRYKRQVGIIEIKEI